MEFEGDVFFDSVAEGGPKPPRPVQPLPTNVKQITIQDPKDGQTNQSRAKFVAQKAKAKKLYKDAKGKGKKMKTKVVTSTMSLLNSAVKEKPKGKWTSKTVNFLFKKVEKKKLTSTAKEKPSFRPMPPPPNSTQARPPMRERHPPVLAPVVSAPIETSKQRSSPAPGPAPAKKKAVSFAPVPKLETCLKPVVTSEKPANAKNETGSPPRPALVKASSSAVVPQPNPNEKKSVVKAKSELAIVMKAKNTRVSTISSDKAKIVGNKDNHMQPQSQQLKKTSNSVVLDKVGSSAKSGTTIRPKVTRGKGEIYKKLYGSAGFPSVA